MKRLVYFYVLKHPETLEIRYFGRTVDPKHRLCSHISACNKDNSHKNNWIRGLPSNPIMDVIYKEFCTLEESINIEKTIMRKLMKRYNLTNSWANCVGGNKLGTLVHQYSLKGDFIKTFQNSNHAAIELNIIDANILRSCKKSNEKGSNSAGGYLWLFEKHKKYPYPLIKYNGEKKILQLDLENNIIAEFNSAREAHKITGIHYKLISQVCNGEKKQTHGYKFKFKT